MININQLNLQLNKSHILKDINISIEKNAVYGLLGPNGSGKTSLIYCLLGLLRYQKGSVLYNEKAIKNVDYQNIGVVFDKPSLYRHLSVIENMHLYSKYRNIDSKKTLEILDVVGMSSYTRKKVKHCSYGMTQRLSIAIALIHNPEILIFDEPLNGLDPKGILDIRNLIIHLNQELKKTILLSSHILSEVEQVATHIAILDKGTKKFEGSIEDMQSQSSIKKYNISTNQNKKAIQLLQKHFKVFSILLNRKSIEITLTEKNIFSKIIKCLKENAIDVIDYKETEATLEDIFLVKADDE